jgi:hypothetical protein
VSNYTNLPLERRALRPVISTLSRTPKDTVPAMLSPSQLYNCHSRSFGMWSGSSTLPRGLPAAGDSRSPRTVIIPWETGSAHDHFDWLSGYIHGYPPLRVISYHISVFIDCICIIVSYVHMVVAWKTHYY